MLLIAVLMVSTVRYPSGKQIDLQTKTRPRTLILFLAIAGLVVLFKEIAVVGICLGYIFFGLVRYWRKPTPSVIDARPEGPTSSM
jgi:CDP-diacylglycerol---serine O-phosphatidyltransferase